ncbi:piggyBac transposable element-derived protein 4-like [Bacillus rossius redtenbacheri]|uniref:piggyBac transposable element-derived protein 4-like n=1 Tax=Bacillus rossius redtenbacheri TaxID=93214 RepID=UPI002FDD96CD
MKAFMGLLYLAGVYRGSRLNLEDLWDPSGDGVETFRLTMSLKRFQFLMRCIRFDNKETRNERKELDRIAPIRECFETFVANCQKSYSLGENVTLDEKLEAFQGRCGFRQYIPSKPAKYGIKIFALVDSKMYYTFNMEVYAGKQPDGPYAVSNHCTGVVHRMVSPIVNSGRNVTSDNWFSDVPLLSDLADKKLSLVATLKKKKWQIPDVFKHMANRSEKSSIFGFRKEGTLVSYAPRKNKNVFLISSLYFDDAIDDSTGPSKKPDIVTFYNETKGGVDTVDKLCATYNVARNARRWPLVIFFAMLNVAGINAQVIYSGNGYVVANRRTFLRQLAKGLVSEEMTRRSAEKQNLHITLRHRLTEVTKQPLKCRESNSKSQEMNDQNNKRKLCEPCREDKQRKNTKYCCATCGKYLCLSHVTIICKDCYECKTSSADDGLEVDSE